MTKSDTKNDNLHEITPEIQALLDKNPELLEKWENITPLAQNEWICYTTMAKQEATREKRRKRMEEDLLNGKKRPCCWPGCPHRRPSAKKWFK